MTRCKQKLLGILLVLICHCSYCVKSDQAPYEDLAEAEAKDGQLEIIKTIKKINDDGSYTIGYEADDGSFKIESRDVLGNIKGTYGYVDEDGEIKRVTYTTNNFTDVLSEAPSVVQRIPKTNKTYSPTKMPGVLAYNPTTQTTPTTTSVIQAIPKRRVTPTQTITTTPSTTTTSKTAKNSEEVIKSTTNRSNIVYAASLPRSIHTQRPLVRSTQVSQIDVQKSEGQIVRPEIVTARPTELPTFRRIAHKRENGLATTKPVTEEPEVHRSVLRRQLDPQKSPPFDPRQHLLTLQQGLGEDSVDVYSASLTTGTPRPLFTTTYRPRVLSASQTVVEKPAARYVNTPPNIPIRQQTTTEFNQEATTTESTAEVVNAPPPIPIYQMLQAQQENIQPPPLVAVKQPFHGGVILVPINDFRAQENPQPQNQPQYVFSNEALFRPARPTPTPSPEHSQNPAPVFVHRQPILKSISVHIDQNGFVHPLPPQIAASTTPYPVVVAITPSPIAKQSHSNEENEIDMIKPPVSTNDFKKLIEILIIRQARLERANALINAQRQRELLELQKLGEIPPHHQQQQLTPVFIRHQDTSHAGPMAFLHENQNARMRPYVTIPQMQVAQQQHQAYIVRQPNQENQDAYVHEPPVTYSSASYVPTKRVSRLLHNSPPYEQDVDNEEYLPPQVREMLLLRMLQLAINPALPLEGIESSEKSASSEQNVRKMGVRNVEVLGEEIDDDHRKPIRNDKYKMNSKEYYK